jgi:hypothetical protein
MVENLQTKLNLLSQIAKELNNRNVTWAIGASMLLYFKGITSEFHDIDIMVSEEDFGIVKEVLLSFGKMQPPNPNNKYRTRYFGEFIIDGVDIDVIAGFIVIDQEKEHYFPLKQERINDFTEVNGTRIPLQALEEWRHYYQLMGRTEKVKMIDEVLR